MAITPLNSIALQELFKGLVNRENTILLSLYFYEKNLHSPIIRIDPNQLLKIEVKNLQKSVNFPASL